MSVNLLCIDVEFQLLGALKYRFLRRQSVTWTPELFPSAVVAAFGTHCQGGSLCKHPESTQRLPADHQCLKGPWLLPSPLPALSTMAYQQIPDGQAQSLTTDHLSTTPQPGTSWPRTWQDAANWQARDPVMAGSLTGEPLYAHLVPGCRADRLSSTH